jgi:hypothetical protein
MTITSTHAEAVKPHQPRKAMRLMAGATATLLGFSGILLTASPALADPGTSRAEAQYLSGTLLGTSLDNLAAIEGSSAEVSASETATETQTRNLNLNVVDGVLVLEAPNGVQIPLDVGEAGVIGQYAQASPDGSSRAVSGLVSEEGVIGVSPDGTNPPGPLSLNLSELLNDDSLGNLRLTTGVNTASATQAAPAAAQGDYNISDLNLVINSDVIAALTGQIDASVDGVQADVDAVVGPDGSLLDALLPAGANVISSNASLDVDLQATVDAVLAENEVLGGEGPVTVNLATGDITVDIAALLAANGQDLNNLPANTELVSPEILALVTAEVDELVEGLLGEVSAAIDTALDTAVLDLNLSASLPLDPETPVLDVALNGTLADIVDGTTEATVTVGDLELEVGVVNLAIQDQIRALLDSQINVTDLLAGVAPLYPVLTDALSSVLSLTVNNQETTDGVFTETALRLTALQVLDADDEALTLNLAQASVGPNNILAPTAGTIAGFTPDQGPETGGTRVVITGTNFTGADEVLFGTTPAASYVVNSDTQITAVSPAGIGAVPLTVVNADGDSIVSEGDFTYIPADTDTPAAPVVSGFTPVQGPEAGGTLVTINGSGFTGADEVLFGTTPGTSFTVVSDNVIRVISPAGLGAVPLTVVGADGGNVITDDDFTYIPTAPEEPVTAPVVSGFTPVEGPEAGGTVVTVNGSGFTGTDSVLFGTTPGTDLVVVSDTVLRVTSPAGVGAVPVTVVNADGDEGTSEGDFTYVPVDVEEPAVPAVTGFTPVEGPEAGGTVVTINGSGFTGADEVLFGTTPGTDLVVVSDSVIRVTSPAGEGEVPLTVVNGNEEGVSENDFTYVPVDVEEPVTPAVISVSPSSGPETGGTVVTIIGSGFTGADEVLFGTTPGTGFTVISDTVIRVTSPAGEGVAGVSIIGATADDNIPGGNFTYVPADVDPVIIPTVDAFTPTQGPEAGGTVVTITGSNFSGIDSVLFGSTPATTFTLVSNTEIRVTAPAGVGSVPLTLIDDNGPDATTQDLFTYVSGALGGGVDNGNGNGNGNGAGAGNNGAGNGTGNNGAGAGNNGAGNNGAGTGNGANTNTAGTQSGNLPVTGFTNGWMVPAGVLLVMAGIGVMLTTRKFAPAE